MILASGSKIRAELLSQAGLTFETIRPRLDEAAIKQALQAEDVSPRDIADALAEAKAQKVSSKSPGVITLGCDQVLDLDGAVLDKPSDKVAAIQQLTALKARPHRLYSAIVACEDGRPIWRHIGKVTLRMRDLSPGFIEDYVDRNWPGLSETVGSYKLEAEGIRLFTAIDGTYHDVLGLPLLPLLNWLTMRGDLET